jgi:response regulator RpfG family c-di-GMP phosphodiesterase
MHFKRRQLLVLLLIIGQLGCMSFGVLWASRWLGSAFEQFTVRSSMAQGRSIADQLARKLADRDIEDISRGTTGWKRAQELCQEIRTPHNGFVAIIDRGTGALICHSGLKDNPTLLRKNPGRSLLVNSYGVKPLIEAAREAGVKRKAPAFGQVEVSGKLYQTTCLGVPRLDAVIAVYQSQASIDQSVAQLVTPVIQVGFILTAAVTGAGGLLTVLLVKKFDMTLAAMGDSIEREVDMRTLALTRSRNAVVFGLAKLAESRDKDAAQHLERIRTYVTILATELAKHRPEIDHHYVASLAIASALHDIGKMGVPDGVILKLGRLTPAERRAMQMHTVLGGECLASVARMFGDTDQFLELGREVALSHHEQWDGSGYPSGLQGKDIPLSARIVALADVYDAMTTNRAYRPAVSHAEAREWIVSNYGSQFDPEVVEAFVVREHDFAKISQASAEVRGVSVESPTREQAADAQIAADIASSEPAPA